LWNTKRIVEGVLCGRGKEPRAKVVEFFVFSSEEEETCKCESVSVFSVGKESFNVGGVGESSM